MKVLPFKMYFAGWTVSGRGKLWRGTRLHQGQLLVIETSTLALLKRKIDWVHGNPLDQFARAERMEKVVGLLEAGLSAMLELGEIGKIKAIHKLLSSLGERHGKSAS